MSEKTNKVEFKKLDEEKKVDNAIDNVIEEKYKIFESILKILENKLSVKEQTSVKNLIEKKNDKTINIDSIDNAIIYFQNCFAN